MCAHPLEPAIVFASTHQKHWDVLQHTAYFSNRAMDYVPPQHNWNKHGVITYSTPPYMTLRENIGFHRDPTLVRPRLLWNMIKEYYIPEDKPIGGQEIGKVEIYFKGISQKSLIHDKTSKWIFFNPVSGLQASLKQNGGGGEGGATFEITRYLGPTTGGKVPVTLKLVGTNLYLSCSEGNLKLENEDETLDRIEGPTKRFLFLRTRGVIVTFQSLESPENYICTDNIHSSAVKVSKYSDNGKIIDFIIDQEMVGMFMLRKERFLPHATLKKLENLEEDYQLMPNTCERFTHRTFGNSFFW